MEEIEITEPKIGLIPTGDDLRPQVAFERFSNLQLQVIKGDWGCIVCQGISGFQMAYLDSQYFIFRDTMISLRLPETGYILRTHTKNWFPWTGEGTRFPARFEDEGGLARFRTGTVPFWIPAGHYRTSDFFLEEAFIKKYQQPYPGLGELLEEPCRYPVAFLAQPFLINHIQRRILEDIHYTDSSLTIARHFITLKSAEYFMRAMNQLQQKGGLKMQQWPASEKELAERISAYLREHLVERLSLMSLAQKMGSNCNHMEYVFKARYGETIHRFQIRLRLDRARYLLMRNPTDPYKKIAAMVGFCDGSAFSRAFQRAFGVRPRDFRSAAARNRWGRNSAG